MRLQANINDARYQIELQWDAGKVFADIDGRRYELDVSEPEPHVFLLKDAGRIHQAYVSAQSSPAGPLRVNVGVSEFEIEIIDPKRLRGVGSGKEHAGGLAEIKTAMPGKVVRILVSEGDPVQKGDGIIVVEAMKMQNELKSQRAGTIQEIRVNEGATVAAGDILAIVA